MLASISVLNVEAKCFSIFCSVFSCLCQDAVSTENIQHRMTRWDKGCSPNQLMQLQIGILVIQIDPLSTWCGAHNINTSNVGSVRFRSDQTSQVRLVRVCWLILLVVFFSLFTVRGVRLSTLTSHSDSPGFKFFLFLLRISWFLSVPPVKFWLVHRIRTLLRYSST
jgi:hypothetical protein